MTETAIDGTRTGSSRRTIVFGMILLVILAFVTLLTLGLRQAGSGPRIGEPAPDFTLSLFDGGQLKLGDLRGQVVVINFWASWCEPCRVEAPTLERVWRDYKDRGVILIGVDYVDVESEARAFMQEFDVTYPNGPDVGQRIARAYRIRGVPETFFVDQDGNIAPIFVGGNPQSKKISPISETELRTVIDRLLAQGGSG